jgi:thiopurine S-methyltransferase
MKDSYWSKRYQLNQIGWDLGEVSKPLVSLFQSLNKEDKILIPGCGNAYEATFLFNKGFRNVHIIDIAIEPLLNFRKYNKEFPENQIIHGDFFDHQANYDVIIEQTFFCAILPKQRNDYVRKCSELLNNKGILKGVLFNRLFEGGPPYGGNESEYKDLFKMHFEKVQIKPCNQSIEPRLGYEVFIECSGLKKS